MLPPIAGEQFPHFPWNSFAYEEVLIYYDGPRLLLQRSRAGQLYLAWWNDTDEVTDRWIYVPVSPDRLHAILSGSMGVLQAWRDPEEGNLVAVDVDIEADAVRQAVSTTIEHLSQDLLPFDSARLNMPFPEEIIGFSLMERTRERTHFLDVIIGGEVGEIAAEMAGHIVGFVQRTLDAIGQAEAGFPTSAGPIPQRIRKQTRLNIVGAYTGSLGLRFETDQQDNESGESLARRSLEGLFGLLERVEPDSETTGRTASPSPSDSVASPSNFNFRDIHAAYVREPSAGQRVASSRVVGHLVNLFSSIETTPHGVSLRWGQPGQERIRTFRITPQMASTMKARIKDMTDAIQGEVQLEGTIVAR